MQRLLIKLNLDEQATERLSSLQVRFAQACQSTFRIANEHNSFGRIALHHLAYKSLRKEFSDLGAQLVSNAIYVVSSAGRSGTEKLCMDSFSESLPVVLDRRTVSITNGQLSLFTLEGRLRLNLRVTPEVQDLFVNGELKEIHLQRAAVGFSLIFYVKSTLPPKMKSNEVSRSERET